MLGLGKSEEKVTESNGKENKELDNFAKGLASELGKNEVREEKSALSATNVESDTDFDLTLGDLLDILGDDNIKSFLAMPEKMAIKLAIKNIPEEDRGRFKIVTESDKRFSDIKLRLTKRLIQKYGGDLNVKVSPEIALMVVTTVSCSTVYIQMKVEADRYLKELEMLKKGA